MKIAKIGLIIFSLAYLYGCPVSNIVGDPKKSITLEGAMKSIGTGLREMREAQGGNLSGLVPTEVEVTFNISTSATDTAKAEINKETSNDVSINTTSENSTSSSTRKVNASAKAELGTEVKGGRANTVTVKFKNIAVLDLSKQDIKKLEELLKVMKDNDITTQSNHGTSSRSIQDVINQLNSNSDSRR